MSWNSSRWRAVFKYLLSAAVAVVLLYFTFREVQWETFVDGLRACRWEWIVVSMLASIAAFWFRGLRWRETLLPIDGSIRRLTTFNAVNIGYIANFVFPRIGEFVRCGFVTKNSALEDGCSEDFGQESVAESGYDPGLRGRKKASYDKVLGTVVLERVWDMVTMFLILVVLLVFKWEDFGTFFVERVWQPFEESLNFSLWWVVVASVCIGVATMYLIYRQRDKSRICRRVADVCKGLLVGLMSCLRMRGKWRFFAYTGLIWLMYWVMSASTMMAMPGLAGLDGVDALFLMVAGSFGWLVPVPGGFGAFHFIVSLALSTVYGIPFATGLVFATLSHESQAITMAVCGGVSYFYESFFEK